MRANTTKGKLASGGSVYGCWLRYSDPALAEFVSYQGWDFVVFDGEHGTLDPRGCENLVRAAELRDATPVVRVTSNDAPVIGRFLDTGAQGAQIPMVNTAADAERAVQAIKYWPRGERGLAASRAAAYGQDLPLAEYVTRANAETLVVAQIETPEGVSALPAILDVDGIDVIFVGATDLSQALGAPGELDAPRVESAIDEIVRAVVPSRCALGVMVSSTDSALRWRDRGARYIAFTLEAMIHDSARAALAAMPRSARV
jgi:2-keto-3-deoxy-L-rhamnonate aldolase RhmA